MVIQNTTNYKSLFPLKFLFLIISGSLILSSCTSKKMLISKSGIAKPSANLVNKYAQMMEVSKKSIKNGKLYSFIEDWQGTQYQYGGLSKNGIDCSGLVYLAFRDVYGLDIPRVTGQLLDIIKRKYEGKLREGDLVFFDFDNQKFSHVGIYLQNGYYFHASTSSGVRVSKLHDPYTYKYFSRGGSIK